MIVQELVMTRRQTHFTQRGISREIGISKTSANEIVVTGRHSQGSPLPGVATPRAMLYCLDIYMGDAVLLEYIRAMLLR